MIARERIVPIAILVVSLMIIGVIGMLGGWNGILEKSDAPVVTVSVESGSVDPLNDGRLVSVQGTLEFERPAADEEMGVTDSAAAVLLRRVEMYQWQESCIADSCTQTLGWFPELIDATQFNEKLGHRNPSQFPFASQTFFADGVRLGAFTPSMELVAAQAPMQARPVRLLEMHANLAASFSELDGGIFAGNDFLNPIAGDLRITYHMVPTGTVTLVGVQDGNRLLPAPAE
ncbi:TMEM43 family protein [Dokdonella sp.]|uniref:TMEM43 family protein n=1 Tax=Dokdonella sp. TaxID=2291710 RepID=UPI003C417D00